MGFPGMGFSKCLLLVKGLVSAGEVFNQDISMEFGLKKGGVIIMNRGKVKSTD